MRTQLRLLFRAAAIAAGLLVTACAQPRLEAVPAEATTEPRILNIAHARFFLDQQGIAEMDEQALASVARERAYLARSGKTGNLPPADFLALSGGGDDGAFGAGVLVGWTAHGDRPQFKLVTGISTGALSAPFAFLGPEYDDALRQIYTEVGPSNIFARRTALAAVSNDAMADSAPLANTIAHYLTDEVVERIAQEYQKGRLLLVATTNLDAAKPVIWNIGAIAQSRDPRARELIQKVLLASASIPGVFPPVLFDVEVGGRHFQEMHVDGCAIAQVFLYPPALRAGRGSPHRQRTAYIIRNGRLSAPWQSVERTTLAVAGRAVSTLIASNGLDDLYRIYGTTRRDGVGFRLAYIDENFTEPYKGPFDTGYMNSLFSYAFELARRGYPWRKTPPGYVDKANAGPPS